MKGRLAGVRNLSARLKRVFIRDGEPPVLELSALVDSTVDEFRHALGFYLVSKGIAAVLESPPPRRVTGVLDGAAAVDFLRAAIAAWRFVARWQVTVPVFYAPEAQPRFLTRPVVSEMPLKGRNLISFQQAYHALLASAGGIRCG
jgi:hypothetical protein